MARTKTRNAGAGFVLILLAMPITTLLYGAVLTRLWAWFVATKFGLPGLSIADGVGLALVVGLLGPNPGDSDDDESDAVVRAATVIFRSLLRSLLALAVGFVVVQFV